MVAQFITFTVKFITFLILVGGFITFVVKSYYSHIILWLVLHLQVWSIFTTFMVDISG